MEDKTSNNATAIGSALHFYNNRLYVGCVYDDGSYGAIDVTEAVAKALSEYNEK